MKESILLIEDEIELQQNLKEILEYNGFSTLTADNGQDGLLKLDKQRVDLILCDIMMPMMDGFQFLKNIRSQPRFKNTPFIFLSAKASKEDKSKGLLEGADDYLIKPVSSRTLLRAIDSILNRRNINDSKSSIVPVRQKEFDRPFIVSEINSPITGIIKTLGTLGNSIDSIVLGDHSKVLKSLLDSAKWLHLSFGKLPLLKNLEDLNAWPVSIDVDSVILEVINNYGAEKFLYLNRPKQSQVFDLEHFRFILNELIENALKFTSNNQSIQIDWEGSSILVRNKQTIFGPNETFSIELFDMRKNEMTGLNGLGIGLFLAMKFCQMNSTKLQCSIDSNQNFIAAINFTKV